MGKIMYKDQDYTSGGEMPEVYDNLTAMLEDSTIEFNSDDDTSGGNIRASATLFDSALRLTGYSTVLVESEGNCSVRLAEGYWGDTESEELGDAISDMCNRIATLEEGGGGGEMPAVYDDLTTIMTDKGIVFEDHPATGDSKHTIDINIGKPSSEYEPGSGIDPNITIVDAYVDIEYTSLNLDRGTLTLESGYAVIDATQGRILNTDEWGDTEEEELSSAIYGMCNRIASLEEGGGGGSMPAEYDGLTWLLDNGYIEFNTESTPYGIKLNNLAAIDLDYNGDIVKAGYWAGASSDISDSSSLVDYMSALSSYVIATNSDLSNLTDTVGDISDSVDTLRNDFDTLNGALAGFTAGYITFEDSNNMTFSSVDLHLYDSDIVNESGYWGAWEDEQTQESSDGFQTTSIIEALIAISKKLDDLEARVTALENH